MLPVEHCLSGLVDFGFRITQEMKDVLNQMTVLNNPKLFQFEEGFQEDVFLLDERLKLLVLGFLPFVNFHFLVLNGLYFLYRLLLQLQILL